jgi:hypothetical protein
MQCDQTPEYGHSELTLSASRKAIPTHSLMSKGPTEPVKCLMRGGTGVRFHASFKGSRLRRLLSNQALKMVALGGQSILLPVCLELRISRERTALKLLRSRFDFSPGGKTAVRFPAGARRMQSEARASALAS